MVTTCVHYRREGDTSLRMVCAVLPTRVSAKQFHTCAAVDPQFLSFLFSEMFKRKVVRKNSQSSLPGPFKAFILKVIVGDF